MKKVNIFLFALNLAYFHSIKAQRVAFDDIDSLPSLGRTEFDSLFSFVGVNYPVNVSEHTNGQSWEIEGVLVDYSSSIGCGAALCTSGVGKIDLAISDGHPFGSSAYIVMGLKEGELIKKKSNIQIRVRYATIEDLKQFNIVLNKFNVKDKFLIISTP